jgi:adenylate kinase
MVLAHDKRGHCVKVLLLAPPGAGKGTQARRLAEHFHIVHIASGELLRAEVERGSQLGQEAQGYLARGDLVPDRLVIAMINDRCGAAARSGGFVLDGFPRNLAQAEVAYQSGRETGLTILDAVVSLEVSEAELRRRLLARAVIEDRSDDNRPVIEHRLAVYREQTEPLLGFYDGLGILHRVNGEQTVDEVFSDIVGVLSALAQ